ncbi:MAG: sulfite exporter TauE/SafE family protein [Dehalococcoidia bacterium]
MTGRRFSFAALLLVAVSALLPLIAAPRHAAAHPLGNFTVNRYARLDLYRDAVDVHYILDFAEIPAFQLREAIDTDDDGAVSSEEIAAYRVRAAAEFADGMHVWLADQRVPLVPLSSEAAFFPGEGGLDTFRIAAVYRATLAPVDAPLPASFEDRNYADRLGWKETVIRPSAGALARVAEELTVDLSDGLRTFPEDALRSAPNRLAVSFEWQPGTGLDAPVTAAPPPAAADSGRATRFDALLTHRGSWSVLVASLAAAFGFGMLHALGPGHGKTVVAAYLVGSRGTVRHAFALGLTVTATHTSMVYLLGFVTIAASAFIVPERLYLYLGLASGIGVVVMGVVLFAARLRRVRPAEGEHRHGWFGRPHSHAPAAVEEHEYDHPHPHEDHHAHPHSHPHTDAGVQPPRVTWRGLLTLGVIGGLLPCPSALLVMLAAISLGQVLYGMLLIVAFSLGLAGVLTAIGISLVLGKHLSRLLPTGALTRHASAARALAYLPALSALGIALAGLLMTYQAVHQFGV